MNENKTDHAGGTDAPGESVYQPHMDAESLRRDIDIQNSRINEINIVLNNAIRRLAALEEKR